MDRTREDTTINHEEETGLGGTTGGGMLGGGTPTDILEGRSAFEPEQNPAFSEGTAEGGSSVGNGLTESPSGDPLISGDDHVLIAHDPATGAVSTDAGLRNAGGTDGNTGGLVSGGLPGDSDKRG